MRCWLAAYWAVFGLLAGAMTSAACVQGRPQGTEPVGPTSSTPANADRPAPAPDDSPMPEGDASSSPADTTNTTPVRENDYQTACSQLAKATCERGKPCLSATLMTTILGSSDPDKCEKAEQDKCLAAYPLPDGAWDARNIAACADARRKQPCTPTSADEAATACTHGAGTRREGSTAYNALQCASSYAVFPKGQRCGVCATYQAPALAKPLPDIDSEAKPSSVPCAADDLCLPRSDCTGLPGQRTCKLWSTRVGSMCDLSRVSAPNCDNSLNLFCDPRIGRCITQQRNPVGSACGHTDDKLPDLACVDGSACIIESGKNAGVCRARPRLGETCRPSDPWWISCDTGSICAPTSADTGTCRGDCTQQTCAPAQICVVKDSLAKCVPYVEAEVEGDSCDPDGVGAPRCKVQRDLRCDPQSKRCVPVRRSDVGQACDPTASFACPYDHWCVRAGLQEANQVCLPALPLKARCSLVSGPPCASAGRCVNNNSLDPMGTCEAIVAADCPKD